MAARKARKKQTKKITKRKTKKKAARRKPPEDGASDNPLLQFLDNQLPRNINPDDFSKGVLSLDTKCSDPESIVNKVPKVLHENPYLKALSGSEEKLKQAIYLQKYIETGRNDLSCRAAGVPTQAFWVWTQEDEDFKEALKHAREIANAHLEDAMIRRGVHGVVKPVYQTGRLVGYIRTYSDSLLTLALKGQIPEKYKDRLGIGGDETAGPIETRRRGLSPDQADELRRAILGIPTKKKE
jgi:hypothetical protein